MRCGHSWNVAGAWGVGDFGVLYDTNAHLMGMDKDWVRELEVGVVSEEGRRTKPAYVNDRNLFIR